MWVLNVEGESQGEIAMNALIQLLSFLSLVQSSLLASPHFPSFVHPTKSLAFVDNTSKKYTMSSSENEVMSDADAYHEMVAAAVDLTSAIVTNGMLSVTRSVRDIDTNSRRSFLYNIPLTNDHRRTFAIPPPTELLSKLKARLPSPSGNKIAILVEEDIPPLENKGSEHKQRHVLELWTDGGHRLAKRIALPTGEMHGAICTDFEWFGGISWSPCETALVYNAEVQTPKAASFFDTSNSSSEKTGVLGGQYTLGVGKSETWGEKYMSTALLGLFCVNVETGKVGAIHNVPKKADAQTTNGGYVLGQAQFSPCGQAVVYTGWDAGGGSEMPRRLGAIYCFQRPCKIYSSPVSKLLKKIATKGNDFDEEDYDTGFDCITSACRLARSPRFSNIVNGKAKLAYLCNEKGFDTHGGCMALHVVEWNVSQGAIVEQSEKTVVDVVSMPGEQGPSEVISGIGFPGLWLNQLPSQCFTPDLKNIVTTSEWGCTTRVISISLDNGSITPIKFNLLDSNGDKSESSQRFLGFTEDGGAIVTQSEANRPLVIGCLQPDFDNGSTSLHPSHLIAKMSPFSCTSVGGNVPCLKLGMGYSYQIINVEPQHGHIKVPVGGVLLLPEIQANKKPPLIVVPHGGPHTCMPTSYERAGLSYGFLCKQGGYSVLHINFRGSTGYGQAALESLAGNAGSLDVLDVVAATRAVIDMGLVDSERVGVCGGSHGGFLAAHLIGQHPDIFKVAAMRNPCINIASMATATDIPDWCYVETLGSYNYSNFGPPTRDQMGIMWDKSPIAHIDNVVAPTLIALGMKDLRVPPSQGLEFFHSLRSRNIQTKLLVYDDCDHAIDKAASEADHWINIKQWFDKHL